MSNIVQHISAEFLKIKSTPVYYLILLASAFVGFIIMLPTMVDVHNVCRIGQNPWSHYFGSSLTIFAVFVISPIITLIISAVMYSEERANAWKYLYTTPNSRASFYFSKLILILIIIWTVMVFTFFFIVLTGNLVNILYPEYEFNYYPIDITTQLAKLTHIYIASLGIIGIQYFLCIRFKHVIIPLGIGMLGFIVAFILSLTNNKLSLYFPYDYPIIVEKTKMFTNDFAVPLYEGSWFKNVELYSIICLLVFAGLGYIYEARRNVHD